MCIIDDDAHNIIIELKNSKHLIHVRRKAIITHGTSIYVFYEKKNQSNLSDNASFEIHLFFANAIRGALGKYR